MTPLRSTILSTVTLLAWLMAAGPALAQQTGSGMKGYWRGDDGAAPTTATDSSGNGYDGTYTSGATTSPSVPTLQFTNPTSMLFNGGNSVDIPTFSFDGSGPITVAFWNYVGTADVHNSSAFSIGNQDQPNRCQAHAPWGDKVLYWDYGDANNNSGRVSTNYAAYLDKWTHVVLVSTGSGGNFQGIYLNGALVISQTTPKGPTVTFTGASIGAWKGAGLYHKSGLDDFRVYNRVLSAQEITDLAAGKSGPVAPTGLTGIAGPGNGQVSLSWNAVAGATCYNVKRSTVAGGSPAGTYTTVASNVTTPTYIDSGLTPGITYYYVVSAVSYGEGPNSNEAACQASPIGISPTTVMVVEAGGTATVTVTLLAGLTSGQSVSIPISTDDTTSGLVSVGAGAPAASTVLTITGPATVGTFLVTGVRNYVAFDPKTFHVKFGTTSSGVSTYNNISFLQDLTCTQTESDLPGVIVSSVSGPATNGGPPVTFTVQLLSIPIASVQIGLGVTIPQGGTTQATVSGPAGTTLTFTGGAGGNWNVPQTVTVTPLLIDTTTTYVTDFAVTLGPVKSGDANFDGMSVPSVPIQEATSTPPLKAVWGGGGCGLMGAEVLLLWSAAVLRGRRRK